MRDLLRAYGALLKASWATMLEYRAQAILWIVSAIFPLVMMVVWLAIVDEAGPIVGWNASDFVSYYVAAAMVNHFTFAWSVWDWDEDVRTGKLSVKLLKPLDPFHHYFSDELGGKLFASTIIVPIVIAGGILFPVIHYPLTPERLLLFVLSVAAGLILNMLISSTLGVLAFWSTQVRNFSGLLFGVGQFLSGWIAPLALFPESFRQIAYVLPFRSTLGLPLEILTGRLDAPATVFAFAVTSLWILCFLILYRVLWRFGLRRYEAVGA